MRVVPRRYRQSMQVTEMPETAPHRAAAEALVLAGRGDGEAVSGTTWRIAAITDDPGRAPAGPVRLGLRPGPSSLCQTPGVGTVTEYLAGLDTPARSLLGRLRVRAMELVPSADEGMSYGMAALRYRGRPLIAVQATKAGYSAYPFSAVVVAAVVARHAGLDATKGGIRFTDERPLPADAYDALVLARRDEIDAALARR